MDSEQLLQRVRVVLCHTTHPGNIGAVARAMKTMGLADLRLVAPGRFPDPQATAMASGASDLLEAARVHDALEPALADTVYAAALSARRRDLSHRAANPREAARILLEHAAHGPVAVVFGQERRGLSNEDVLKCRVLVQIPANPAYSSLNLAQAVQVMAYELRMAAPGLAAVPDARMEPARGEDVERMFEHLERTLAGIGFLKPRQPKRLMERLRRMLVRAGLEKEEVNILRGILKTVDRIAAAARDVERPARDQ